MIKVLKTDDEANHVAFTLHDGMYQCFVIADKMTHCIKLLLQNHVQFRYDGVCILIDKSIIDDRNDLFESLYTIYSK